MLRWLTEEPYKTIWQSLAAIVAVLSFIFAILKKIRGKNNTANSVNAIAGNKSQQIINYGITLEEHEAALLRQEERIRIEIKEALENEEYDKREKLVIKLNAVTAKLNDLQNSYEEEKKRAESAIEALNIIVNNYPSTQIERAKKKLLIGESEEAEAIFDKLIEVGSPLLALAYYQKGQLAENRIDYPTAIKMYRKAISLDNSNKEFLLAAGNISRQLGDNKSSLLWMNKLLSLSENHNDENLKATTLHMLGHIYDNMANYNKAIDYYSKSAALKEKLYGFNDPSSAITLSNLAGILQEKGDFVRAGKIYKHVIKIKENNWGKNDPSLAVSINNLATLCGKIGLYKEAGKLYKRSLDIKEKYHGPMHPELASTLNNLGDIYSRLGKLDKAELLFQRSFSIVKTCLGEDHPHISTILNNLGLLNKRRGRLKKAEELFINSIAITEKHFGSDHPHTISALNNLAGIYGDRKDFEKAETCYLRSLIIIEKTFGPDHPQLATTMNNLAGIYMELHKYKDALSLCERMLNILEYKLPEDHPDIKTCKSNYKYLKTKLE